jgi:hypothetical protein
LNQRGYRRAGLLAGQVAGAISLPRGVHDAARELVDRGVRRVKVVGAIVREEQTAQAWIRLCPCLIAEQLESDRRVRCEHEDPQVGLQRDPACAEAGARHGFDPPHDLRRQALQMAGFELPQSLPGRLELADPGRQIAIELVQRAREAFARRRSERVDPGERNAGFGERTNLEEIDRISRSVATVPRPVAFGLGEQLLRVVHADRLGRYTDVARELTDREHVPIFALDLDLGATCNIRGMTKASTDRETLRAIADEGNELALDRLADLADARGDLVELGELLDEGCAYAGHLLTVHAVAAEDLRALQHLADAGCDEADRELALLLRR